MGRITVKKYIRAAVRNLYALIVSYLFMYLTLILGMTVNRFNVLRSLTPDAANKAKANSYSAFSLNT